MAPRGDPMKRLALFLCLVAISGVGVWLGPTPTVRGIAAILLLFTVVGAAITWAARASTRLSSSEGTRSPTSMPGGDVPRHY